MALSAASPARARRAFAMPFAGRLALGAWVDVLVVGALVALAGAVRWPNLLLSPQFPSVGDTIMAALEMSEGQAFYLHDSAPYLGAPFIWLLALAYRVFGPSLEVTLLVPWALGALTVVPTYLLGRELAGRTAGLVAAMLLATAGAHVVVTSHVVLSHSLTPLCSTFTLWLLARAVMRQSGRSLALAGLGAGISLQTHPTVLPLLAGSAVAVLLVRPAWLRTRWPYLALVLVVVGYSTLLANHVLNGFEVVADIESKQETYLEGGEEAGEAADRGLYLTNLASLSVSLARMTSGQINERETRAEYLVDPWILSYPVLAVLGALIAARRGNPLLLVALAVAVFWPPLLSGKYKPILDGRYLMPDLPVLFVDIAVAFGALAGLVARGAPALRLAGGAAIAGRGRRADAASARPARTVLRGQPGGRLQQRALPAYDGPGQGRAPGKRAGPARSPTGGGQEHGRRQGLLQLRVPVRAGPDPERAARHVRPTGPAGEGRGACRSARDPPPLDGRPPGRHDASGAAGRQALLRQGQPELPGVSDRDGLGRAAVA